MSLSKEEIKALAEKHGIKKPIMKSDYSQGFYDFVDHIGKNALRPIKRLRDHKEQERLSGRGKGTITADELTKAINDVK